LGILIGKDKLIELHSEWIRYCWDSDSPRALQAFRGGYKTTAIDVVGTIRWLLFHPDDRVAIIRKNYGDAAMVIDSIKKAMETPQLRELFKYAHGHYPKATVDREGKLSYNFKTTNTPESSLTAHGLGSSLTGWHYDKIICDDFVTIDDRTSRAERKRTARIVREIATNIIDPNKGSAWIGTPWHSEDAWTVVNSFTDIAYYPLSRYNFLGEDIVEQKRKTTPPLMFAANYELEIRSGEGSLFTEPVYAKGWDYLAKNVMAHVDAAFDGDHYCALTIMSLIEGEQSSPDALYQAIGWVYPGNIKAWRNEVVRLCRKYRARHIHIETNPDKGYTADKLAESGLRVKPYAEKMNKYYKISTFAYEIWEKIRWSPDTDPEYMNQLLDYSEGMEPDDAPDSLASLIRQGFKTAKPAAWALYS
jgi:hypothetical protein